jgi:hypothetical protein
MPSINEIVSQLGMQLDEVNEDGSASFTRLSRNGEKTTGKIDARGLAQKLSGMDVSQLPMSSEAAPLSESGLSFGQQVDFIRAKSSKDKIGFLKEKFGEENVRQIDDQISVRGEDGNWRQGSISDGWKGFAVNMSKSLPAMGGATAGGLLGAGIATGLATGPIGWAALAGSAILGSGIGAAIGEATDIATARALGIRNELDATEVAKEIGNEFLLGLTAEAGSIGLRMTPFLFTKALDKIRGASGELVSGTTAAGILKKFYGVSDSTITTALKEGGDVIRPFMMEDDVWNNAVIAGKTSENVSPIIKKAANIIQDLQENTFNRATSVYGVAENNLLKASAGKTVSVENELRAFFEDLRGRGLVDNEGKFIPPRMMAKGDLASAAELKKAYERFVNFAARTKGQFTVQDILDLEKTFRTWGKVGATDSAAIAESAKAVRNYAVQFKSRFMNPAIKELGGDAAENFFKVQEGYSNYLKTHKSINSLLKAADNKHEQLLPILINDGQLQDNLLKYAQSVGMDASQDLRKLKLINAALELNGKIVAKGGASGVTGIAGTTKDIVASPKFTFLKASDTFRRISSKVNEVSNLTPTMAPQAAGTATSNIFDAAAQALIRMPDKNQERQQLKSKSLDQSRLMELNTMGKASQTIRALNPKQKERLLQVPQMMQQLVAPMQEVQQMYQQMTNQLKQQTASKIKGK